MSINSQLCWARIMWIAGPFTEGDKEPHKFPYYHLGSIYLTHKHTLEWAGVYVYSCYCSCYEAKSPFYPDLLLSFPPTLNDWQLWVDMHDNLLKEKKKRKIEFVEQGISPNLLLLLHLRLLLPFMRGLALCVHGGMERYGGGNTGMQDGWMAC